MKRAFLLFFTFVFVVGIYSCKKDPAPALDLGYNYFPDAVGTYVVYNVDSIYYDEFYVNPVTKISPADTFKFQLKEKIQSVYTDNEGRPALRLERYVKYYIPGTPYSAIPWTLRGVWSETKTVRVAEKVEDNQRFIKLAFPIKEDQIWNGNAQNTLPAEDYNYEFFDFPRTIGGVLFDSVLEVKHHDKLTLVSDTISNEKYARNVGLIYKRFVEVNSQPNPLWNATTLAAFYNLNILDRVFKGRQYTWTVAYHGIE